MGEPDRGAGHGVFRGDAGVLGEIRVAKGLESGRGVTKGGWCGRGWCLEARSSVWRMRCWATARALEEEEEEEVVL